MHPGLLTFFILLALACHAFFSLAETSVLNVRKSRLREMAEDDEVPTSVKSQSATILKFKLHPEHFLATVQSGAVFCGFVTAALCSLLGYQLLLAPMQKMFSLALESATAFTIVVSIIAATILDLTFGALIPKSIALHRSEKIAFALSGVLSALVGLFKPITHVPVLMSNIVLKPFRDKTSFVESRISEEEFRVMLEEGARTGVIDKTENELIENIFDFRDRTAREIMVPRIKISAIDITSNAHEVIQKIIDEGFTRLPVYQDTLDNIVGVIYSKDVVALLEHPQLIILHDIIRPVPYVPETKLIAELLREFQHEKHHMAIVLDEFGGTAGLITLEDIVEEIVGEIHDEYDEEAPTVQADREKRSVVLSANYAVADANEHLEKVFPDFAIPDDEEYETVSGYVNKLFGYIPEVGEVRETEGIHIVVQDRDANRVLEVRFEDRGEPKLSTTSKKETA